MKNKERLVKIVHVSIFYKVVTYLYRKGSINQQLIIHENLSVKIGLAAKQVCMVLYRD